MQTKKFVWYWNRIWGKIKCLHLKHLMWRVFVERYVIQDVMCQSKMKVFRQIYGVRLCLCVCVCVRYICINVKIMALPSVQHARIHSSAHIDVVNKCAANNSVIENGKHFKCRTNDSNQNGSRHAYNTVHCFSSSKLRSKLFIKLSWRWFMKMLKFYRWKYGDTCSTFSLCVYFVLHCRHRSSTCFMWSVDVFFFGVAHFHLLLYFLLDSCTKISFGIRIEAIINGNTEFTSYLSQWMKSHANLRWFKSIM